MLAPARIHIDLETLGIRPDAAVISIGVALFMPGATAPVAQQHHQIDFTDALRHGRADGDTIAWWFKQPDAPRLAVLNTPTPLADALTHIAQWITHWTDHFRGNTPLEIMANGPAFDCVILHRLFCTVLKQPAPWKYWQERDYRTARNQLLALLHRLGGDTSTPERTGAHNALADAIHQGRVIGVLEDRLHMMLDRIGGVGSGTETGEVAVGTGAGK